MIICRYSRLNSFLDPFILFPPQDSPDPLNKSCLFMRNKAKVSSSIRAVEEDEDFDITVAGKVDDTSIAIGHELCECRAAISCNFELIVLLQKIGVQ